MWYQKFDTYILGLGFLRSKANHCVYSKQVGDHFINIVLYVDDMLFIRSNKDVIKEVKSQLSSKFDMKDLDATNFILGMEIRRDRAHKMISLIKQNMLRRYYRDLTCKKVSWSSSLFL